MYVFIWIYKRMWVCKFTNKCAPVQLIMQHVSKGLILNLCINACQLWQCWTCDTPCLPQFSNADLQSSTGPASRSTWRKQETLSMQIKTQGTMTKWTWDAQFFNLCTHVNPAEVERCRGNSFYGETATAIRVNLCTQSHLYLVFRMICCWFLLLVIT